MDNSYEFEKKSLAFLYATAFVFITTVIDWLFPTGRLSTIAQDVFAAKRLRAG